VSLGPARSALQAASAAKALVETNKEEIKGKVQDQVMDKLKGLLGR